MQHVCTCGQGWDLDLESWPGQMGSEHPLPHQPSLRWPLLGCFRVTNSTAPFPELSLALAIIA